MSKATVFARRVGIILCMIVFLATPGCRAKREATSATEKASNMHRLAESSLNDSISVIINISFDSAEIVFADRAATDATQANRNDRHSAKAYGVRATLRSERTKEAVSTEKETESATEKESTRTEISGTVNPLGKCLSGTVFIIFSAMLIFLYIKRKKSAKK